MFEYAHVWHRCNRLEDVEGHLVLPLTSPGRYLHAFDWLMNWFSYSPRSLGLKGQKEPAPRRLWDNKKWICISLITFCHYWREAWFSDMHIGLLGYRSGKNFRPKSCKRAARCRCNEMEHLLSLDFHNLRSVNVKDVWSDVTTKNHNVNGNIL